MFTAMDLELEIILTTMFENIDCRMSGQELSREKPFVISQGFHPSSKPLYPYGLSGEPR